MPLNVSVVTRTLDAAPGEVVVAGIILETGGVVARAVSIRVLGVGRDDEPPLAIAAHVLQEGAIEVGVPIAVPTTYGVGRHAVAIEVTSESAQDRAVLVHVTVSIASVRHVVITPTPATVRGRRRVAFDVDVENREPSAVDLTMSGAGTGLAVRFTADRIRLQHGERARTRARVRGPRHWSGEPVQHVVTFTARGRGDDTSVTARYIQRSLVPARVRTMIAAFTILALFVAGAIVIADRVVHRGDEDAQVDVEGATVDGTGSERPEGSPGPGGSTLDDAGAGGTPPGGTTPDGGTPPAGPTDAGSGDPGGSAPGDDTTADGAAAGSTTPGGGSGSAGMSAGGAAISASRVTETAFYGIVTLSDGSDAAGVNVTADPIALEAPRERTVSLAAPAGSSRPAKIWPARFGVGDAGAGISAQRATVTVDPYVDRSVAGGEWLIDAVALRQNYEVVFAKDGYTTKSFVVSPPDSGDRVELDVQLVPGVGSISGTVVDEDGTRIGGVALTATDGTVTISTTSNSVASANAGVGDFSLESLSVPSVYTVVAQLDGYGTEVARFDLAIGVSSFADQTIEMRSGVGSISGRVFQNGVVLGGASVVATIGEQVYRTTTLTGDLAGTYYLPRLRIPETGSYSITASGAGVTPQSQARVVDGNETGVDFRLTSSTGGIRGTVVSDSLGPLPGAFVTITRDNIDFTTTTSGNEGSLSPSATAGAVADGASLYLRTAAAPTPGAFEIGDLPPGEYVLTVEDYRHATFARSITVAAGPIRTVPDGAGPIVLATLPLSGVAFGTLTVAAIDDATRAPIPNAQYTLEGEGFARTSLPVTVDPTKDPPDYFQAFQVPAGTYTLTITKTGYRDERLTVSVGITSATRTVEMRAKGPLSVKVVDRASGADEIVLGGFTLQAVSVSNPALPPLVGGIVTDTAGNTYWETAPGVDVANGVWLLQVTGHPAGFHIEPQPLVAGGVPMQFEITRDSPSRAEFVLVAQPYPSLDVTLSRPTGTGVTLARLDQPASTVVVLDCPSSGRPATPLAQVMVGDARDPGAYDIDPVELQAAVGSTGRLADCFLSISAESFAARRVDFAPALALGEPTARRDRRIHAMMLPPAYAVTGTLHWLPNPVDPSSRIDLRNASITATGVVTGYAESQTDDGSTPSPPRALQSDVAARWSSDGTFTLDAQVFGTFAYTIVPPRISPGVFEVTVPPGPNLVSATSGVVVAPIPDADPTDRSFRYDMRLTDPIPGQISGCVRLVSLHPEVATDVQIDAFSPGSTTPDGVITRPASPGVPLQQICLPTGPGVGSATDPVIGTFSIDDAAAGDWRVAFGAPPNYVPWNTPANPQTPRVPPGGTVTDLSATVVEQGAVTVSVLGDDGAGPPAALATAPTAVITGGLLTTTLGGAVTTPGLRIAGVPVDLTVDDPTASRTGYQLSIVALGYDTANATIDLTIDGVLTHPTDARSIVFDVAAGSEVVVAIVLPRFGSVSGSVSGVPFADLAVTAADERLEAAIQDPASLAIRGRRVRDANGVSVTPGDWIDATITAGSASFSLSGAPGFYQIEVVHPLYDPSAAPATDRVDPLDPSEVLYRIANNADNALSPTFEMTPKSATVSLEVLVAAGGSGVSGAGIRLYRRDTALFPALGARVPIVLVGTADFPGGAAFLATSLELGASTEAGLATSFTDGGGQQVLVGLAPGDYWLELRLAGVRPDGSTGDLFYPVIAAITVPLAADAGERLLTVRAVMPPMSATISGTLRVLNENGDIGDDVVTGVNNVPVPPDRMVSRTYTGPVLLATPGQSPTGSTLPNLVTGEFLTSETVPAIPSSTTAPLESTFTFANVPEGTHALTTTMPAGYTLLNPADLQVQVGTGVATVTLWYRVESVDLDVRPTDSRGSILAVPDLTATLSYEGIVVAGPVEPAGGRLVFPAVTPRSQPYTITVDSGLHAPTQTTVDVVPTTATCPAAPTRLCQIVDVSGVVVDGARISGELNLSNAATDGPADLLDVPASAELELFGPNGSPVTVPETYGGDGAYTLTIPNPVAGSYLVRLRYQNLANGTDSEYTTEERVVAVIPGRSVAQDITLRRKPIVIVLLTNPPDTATVEIVQPGTGIVGVPNGTSTQWTFRVLPDVAYQFRALGDPAGRYSYPILAPAAARTFVYGTTTSLPATGAFQLQTRAITVTVNKSGNAAASATVLLEILDTDPDPAQSTTTNFTGNDPQDVVAFPLADQPPLRIAGQARATVTAPGYRSATGTAPSTNRTADIVVTIRPNVTLTGTIGGAPAGTEVIATSATGAEVRTTTDADGEFSFTGANSFGNGTWTIRAQSLGRGRIAERTFTVTEADVAVVAGSGGTGGITRLDADRLTAGALVFVPRTIRLTLTVQRSNGAVLTGSTLSPAPTGYGPPVTVTESGTAYDFDVAHSGSLDGSLSFSLVAGDVDPMTWEIALARTVVLDAAPAISGTAVPAGGNVNGADVDLFLDACPGTGLPPVGNPVNDDTIANGSNAFSFPATASTTTDGAHCLVVTHSTGGPTPTVTRGRLSISVTRNANGPATVAALATTPASGDTITVTVAP